MLKCNSLLSIQRLSSIAAYKNMDAEMSAIRDYQVDHLLLLVGSNPVPNAVAGKLLIATGGTITLIHSADGLDLVQRLKGWFLKAGYSNISFIEVEESDAASVYESVQTVLKTYERGGGNAHKSGMTRVGLNYTGGTKVMSVQAHRALEDWARSPGRDVVFSYLDAHTLRMRFDQAIGRSALSFPVGLEVDISIKELLKLHNWEAIKEPILAPVLPESAAALLAVHGNAPHARIWTEWLRTELFRAARKPVALHPPFWVSQEGKRLPGEYMVEQPEPNDQWKSKTQLRNLTISWPDLQALREAMSNELGQYGSENLDLKAATAKGCKDEKDFCKWLSGTWLESAVLSALQNCPQELHLNDCCMDIKPKEPGQSGSEPFQFDVVAIRGYQLFAFSCSTESASQSGGRGLLKHKLFEAYVRAQQMGGDEARVALVCCIAKAEAARLEAEMRRDLRLKGHIRVFGREHLVNLTENIQDWVREQSEEN